MIVTTLPISYRENRSFKIFFTPFVAKCISRLCLAETFFPINLMGLKETVSPDSYSTVTQSYRKSLNRLGLLDQNSYVINDTDYLFHEYLSRAIANDITSGKCFFDDKEMSFCDCGRVELPHEVLIRLNNEDRLNLIEFRNNTDLICRLCGTLIQRKKERVLLRQYRVEEMPSLETISPFYSSRVSGIMERTLCEHTIISRSHRVAKGFLILDNGLIVDPDYCWAHFLGFLSKINNQHDFVLVVGVNHIYHACKTIISTFDPDREIKISLIVTPLINMASLDKRLTANMTTDDLIAFFGSPEATQIFLSLFLQWNRMETSMSHGNIEVVINSLGASKSKEHNEPDISKKRLSVRNAPDQLSNGNILRILKKIRQRINLSLDEQRLFQAIS